MNEITKQLLEQVADLHTIPTGAYNIRKDGSGYMRNTTKNIDIITKTEQSGIDIRIKAGTKNESVYIPVVISQTGLQEIVYNDFFIGEDSDVTIIAGCGIHNNGDQEAKHDGVHRFYLEKNAKVRYVEKHVGEGDGIGERVMNPTTEVYMKKGSYMEMEMTQLKGVDSTERMTIAKLDADAKLVVREKLLTHGKQNAISAFDVTLDGENSGAHIVSRSVAKDDSTQRFISKVEGNESCTAHTECDAIIMDRAKISAVPEITANHMDASLIHEAAIGKIAGEQIIKLMTLGLTQEEAEEKIVNGFLK